MPDTFTYSVPISSSYFVGCEIWRLLRVQRRSLSDRLTTKFELGTCLRNFAEFTKFRISHNPLRKPHLEFQINFGITGPELKGRFLKIRKHDPLIGFNTTASVPLCCSSPEMVMIEHNRRNIFRMKRNQWIAPPRGLIGSF